MWSDQVCVHIIEALGFADPFKGSQTHTTLFLYFRVCLNYLLDFESIGEYW